MKKILILFTAIICYQTSFSQSAIKRADKLFDTYYYLKAAQTYNEAIKGSKDDVETETLLKAADANYLVNNTLQAKNLYQRVYQRDTQMEEPHLSRFVRSLRSEGLYNEAHDIYTKYLKRTGNQTELELTTKRFETFKAQLEDDSDPAYRLTNLASNSSYSDFAPVIYGENLIFSSSRPGNSKELYSRNEQPFLSLFIVETENDSIIGQTTVFSKKSKSNYHDAALAIMPDTSTVFFTTSNVKKNKLVLDKKRRNHFQLYKGNLVDGEIVNKEKLSFNSDVHSVSHPFVSSDGKYLFFASDMEGGFGGSDIYYCTIDGLGVLSEPKNAGKNINTPANDFFPFLLDNTLYYSSNGPVGYGGLDVFKSTFNPNDNSFLEIENLGKGINSSKDDFSIVFDKDEQTGYIASNREGGLGDDDIYYFTNKPIIYYQMLGGLVTDKESKEPLVDALIIVKDENNEILTTTTTDETGDYEIELPCNTEVTLIASKEDYLEETKIGRTSDKDQEKAVPVNFELKKIDNLIVIDEKDNLEKLNLDPIFFDYNKDVITPQAATVLDEAVKVMNFYPNMVIKIESHTDSRGRNSYNLDLSDRRAKSTQQYLYSQGITKERIESAVGFGETRLLNKCSNGVKCSNEEHDINRRSDFIIIKK